jgi:molecular chaperone HtpG
MGSYMIAKKTMEINPHHIIIKTLKERYSTDETSKTLADLINLIFESSLIASGFNIEEPATFVNRINNMIKLGLSLDEDEDEDEDEKTQIKEVDEDKDKDEDETQMEELD